MDMLSTQAYKHTALSIISANEAHRSPFLHCGLFMVIFISIADTINKSSWATGHYWEHNSTRWVKTQGVDNTYKWLWLHSRHLLCLSGISQWNYRQVMTICPSISLSGRMKIMQIWSHFHEYISVWGICQSLLDSVSIPLCTCIRNYCTSVRRLLNLCFSFNASSIPRC